MRADRACIAGRPEALAQLGGDLSPEQPLSQYKHPKKIIFKFELGRAEEDSLMSYEKNWILTSWLPYQFH